MCMYVSNHRSWLVLLDAQYWLYTLAPSIINVINFLQVPRNTCRPITPQKPPRKSKGQVSEESSDTNNTRSVITIIIITVTIIIIILRSHSQPAPGPGLANSSLRERSSSAASAPSLSQKNFKVNVIISNWNIVTGELPVFKQDYLSVCHNFYESNFEPIS